MKSCRMCGQPGSTFELRPLTCGLRVLSLDGGGVRGKIIVLILALLQQYLRGGLKIQHLFDAVVGTSVGKDQ